MTTANAIIKGNERECSTVDYKRETPDDIQKDIAAMANTDGGTIIIGVDEGSAKGYPTTVVGIADADVEEQKIRSKLRDTVSPPLNPTITGERHQATGNLLLTIHVPKSSHTHLVWDQSKGRGTVYRRNGSMSMPLTREQLTRALNPSLPVERNFCIETVDGKVISPVEIDAATEQAANTKKLHELSTVIYRDTYGQRKEIDPAKIKQIVFLDRTASVVIEHHWSNPPGSYLVRIWHKNGINEPKAAATFDDALDKLEEIIRIKAKDGVLVEPTYRKEDVPFKSPGQYS